MKEVQPLSPMQSSFVIQFDASTCAREGYFTGRVEHVASGKEEHFRTLVELVTLVTGALSTRTPETATERAELASHTLAVRRGQARPFLFPGEVWNHWKQLAPRAERSS